MSTSGDRADRAESIRREFRAWYQEHRPRGWGDPSFAAPGSLAEQFDFQRRWYRTLAKGGWTALTWAEKYGGRALGVGELLAFQEECIALGTPQLTISASLDLIGLTIIAHGSEEHRQRYLPGIRTGDKMWGQGFSEPNAGSDLASLRTSAVLEGETWRVNGQKIWTTYAQFSDYLFLLARTDPDAPKHKGISMLFTETHVPGIEIRPLRDMSGHEEFNEVFFTDVLIPKGNLIGVRGGGWDVAGTTLEHERGTLWAVIFQATIRDATDRLARSIRDNPALLGDPLIRQRIAQCWIDGVVLRENARALMGYFTRGEPLGAWTSLQKLLSSETDRRLQELAIQLRGLDSLIDLDRSFPYFWSIGSCIFGGTNEIQRNVIAQRLLGLPRR